MIPTRICRQCGQEKHEDAFATRNGHAANICKPCDVARQQDYRRRAGRQARAKPSKPTPSAPAALATHADRSSWWLDLPRAAFQEQAVLEEPRMSASRVGKWLNLTGSDDTLQRPRKTRPDDA